MSPECDYIVGPLGARLQTQPISDAPMVLSMHAWTPITLIPNVVEIVDTNLVYYGESRWLRFNTLWLWAGRLMLPRQIPGRRLR